MVSYEMDLLDYYPSPAVVKWLNSVGENTRTYYKWHFDTFIKGTRENSEQFAAMSPDDMVDYILDATPRQVNAFLNLKKAYLQSMTGTKSFASA